MGLQFVAFLNETDKLKSVGRSHPTLRRVHSTPRLSHPTHQHSILLRNEPSNVSITSDLATATRQATATRLGIEAQSYATNKVLGNIVGGGIAARKRVQL